MSSSALVPGVPINPTLLPEFPWCVQVHTIRAGDTCWDVAREYHIEESDLRTWSPYLGRVTCENLEIGARLCVAASNLPSLFTGSKYTPAPTTIVVTESTTVPPPPPTTAVPSPQPTTQQPGTTLTAPPSPTRPPPRAEITSWPFTYYSRCFHRTASLCRYTMRQNNDRDVYNAVAPCDNRCDQYRTTL